MATIACPNCDKQINAAATRCKYCGWAPGQPTIGGAVTGEPTVPIAAPPPTPKKPNHALRNILVIVGVLVLGCVGLAIVSPPSSQSATPTSAAVVSGQSVAQASAPTPQPAVPTAAPTAKPAPPTPAPPTATAVPPSPTPQPVGTRQNPVPKGEVHTFRKGNQTYTFQVVEAQRNALATVKKANQFNATPPEGEDYLLVKVRLKYLEGGQDKPMKTSSGEHRYYADNRFWGAPSFIVSGAPEFAGQDIFPGATVEGWLDGKHLPRTLMDQAVLVYDGVYFGL